MVAVGYVDSGQRLECARDLVDGRVVGNCPKLVAHAVVRGDINFRLAGRCLGQNSVDSRCVRIAAHHRTGLGIDSLDLPDAIIFFCWRRQLVLANTVDCIGFERGDGGEAGLDAVAPGEPIDVITRLAVARQNAIINHAVEILSRFGVDGLVVRIGGRVEIDLRL